jgi:hypothetical protein
MDRPLVCRLSGQLYAGEHHLQRLMQPLDQLAQRLDHHLRRVLVIA